MRTWYPRSNAIFETVDPINPVPPRTRIFGARASARSALISRPVQQASSDNGISCARIMIYLMNPVSFVYCCTGTVQTE